MGEKWLKQRQVDSKNAFYCGLRQAIPAHPLGTLSVEHLYQIAALIGGRDKKLKTHYTVVMGENQKRIKHDTTT